MKITSDQVANEVFAAAGSLVHAFGSHNTDSYFSCFSKEATFVFYNHSESLCSRADYEALWHAWERQGFQVVECRSMNGAVQVLDDNHAIFTHRVRTRLAGEDNVLRERESIVFRRFGQDWLAVHEHLSAEPDDAH